MMAKWKDKMNQERCYTRSQTTSSEDTSTRRLAPNQLTLCAPGNKLFVQEFLPWTYLPPQIQPTHGCTAIQRVKHGTRETIIGILEGVFLLMVLTYRSEPTDESGSIQGVVPRGLVRISGVSHDRKSRSDKIRMALMSPLNASASSAYHCN